MDEIIVSDAEVIDAILAAVVKSFDDAGAAHASGKYSLHPPGSPEDGGLRRWGYYRWQKMKQRACEMVKSLKR